jgi:hypothetical protein
METPNEVNRKIIDIVEKMRQHHPELIKYLDELSVTLPNESDPTMNVEALNAYFDLLFHLNMEANQ